MPYAAQYSKLFRKYVMLSVTGVLALLAGVVLLAGQPERAKAAEVSCPQFHVLHNDRIGQLRLPAGWYDVTVLNGDKLTCERASTLFTHFLQDWDGVLPGRWVVNVRQSSFTRGRGTDFGFRVSQSGGGGGGGGGGGSTGQRSCPGFFTVLHNDRIGNFRVPKGKYRITLTAPNRFSCQQAVSMFAEFLQDYDGVLPKPWFLNQDTATFTRGRNGRVGFRVKQAVGPAPNPNRNTAHQRCPATFRVLHNDRIGALSLPAGPYWIILQQRRGLTCNAASNYFRQFLNDFDGNLPSPWRLNANRALFRMGPGGVAFRVKQVG